MAMTEMVLRSVLYMPATNQRAMDKARTLPVDAVVFDLEDAVAPVAKADARAAVIAQLEAGGYGYRRLVVRCNGLDSSWGRDDLLALADSAATTLCLPKVETETELASVRALLASAGRDDIQLWAMIETPAGVANSQLISASAQVEVLVMGTTDLASALRVPHTEARLGLQYALGQVVLAARRCNKQVLDGVYLDLNDSAGFVAACELGRELGFDGKTLIHPNQIAAANHYFGPTEAAIKQAARVLQAWREAEQSGKGVAVLDGKLIELMHVDDARRVLACAQWIEAAGAV